MKGLIFTLLAVFMLAFSGCSTKYFMTYSVQSINVNKNISFINNEFSNEKINVSFSINNTSFEFNIKNKTNEPLYIDWNKITYIDVFGVSKRMIHKGIRYIEKNEKQDISIIPPHAALIDILIPVDNIIYYSGEFGGWNINYLFPYYTKNRDVRNKWISSYLGKEICLYFPIKIGDIEETYTFIFKLYQANVIQHNPDKKYIIHEGDTLNSNKK